MLNVHLHHKPIKLLLGVMLQFPSRWYHISSDLTFFVSSTRQMKVESGSLPVAVRDSEERLSKGGVYLLETGLQLFLWVGASVQQELLLNIFGTPSFSQIDGSMVRGDASASVCCLLILGVRPAIVSSMRHLPPRSI